MTKCPYCKEEISDKELIDSVYLYHQDHWFAAQHANCYPIFFQELDGSVQMCTATIDKTNLYLVPGEGERLSSDYKICAQPNNKAQISYKKTVKKLSVATQVELSSLYIGR
jgi:hypothetical protein